MSNTMKLILGALATAILSWFLWGPLGFGEKCAKGANSGAQAIAPAAPSEPTAPATAQAVTACQDGVNAAITGKTINFDTSRATIKADSNALLDAIAASLKDCAGTSVEVGGHTDQRGSDATNQALSQARAEAVVAALAQRGVPAERLAAKGYGESKPLDAALTAAAYEKNRRTEFTVSAAAAPAAAGQ